MRRRAREPGADAVMIGCMVSTSLSIAPAHAASRRTPTSSTSTGRGGWRATANSAMRFSDGRLRPPRGGWGAPG